MNGKTEINVENLLAKVFDFAVSGCQVGFLTVAGALAVRDHYTEAAAVAFLEANALPILYYKFHEPISKLQVFETPQSDIPVEPVQ
jgi:hypothetical protein